MTSLKKILAATALAGSVAVPAAALDIGVDAGLGISFEDGISINADAGLSAEAGAPEAPEGYVVVADSSFVGDTVVTSDGVLLGSVDSVYQGETNAMVYVPISEDAGIEGADAFWFPMTADADADGTLVIPMTQAEFQAKVAG